MIKVESDGNGEFDYSAYQVGTKRYAFYDVFDKDHISVYINYARHCTLDKFDINDIDMASKIITTIEKLMLFK